MFTRQRLISGLILLGLDVFGLYFSIAASQFVRFGYWGRELNTPLALVVLLTVFVFYIMDLYVFDRNSRTTETLIRTALAVVASSAVVASLIYLTRSFEVDPVLWRSVFLLSMFIFFVWAILSRYLVIRFIRFNHETHWIVVGGSSEFEQLVNNLNGLDSSVVLKHINEKSFLEQFSPKTYTGVRESLGGVVVTQEQILNKQFVSTLMQHRLRGCRVMSSEAFYEEFGMKIPVQFLQDNWFVLSEGFSLLHHAIALRIKRVFDVFISSLGLVMLVPIAGVIGIAIRLGDGGSVFYRQDRAGKDGQVFSLYKFRTMVENAESGSAVWAGQNDPRVTTIGRWLRKTRIDELPQLWSVLKGDMSFVGPRPERPEFNILLEEKIPYYDLRHLVKPGMTGWAQVMYPYGASVEDALRKLEYDLYYIKNYSLVLDLFIILRTSKVVLSRSGQ